MNTPHEFDAMHAAAFALFCEHNTDLDEGQALDNFESHFKGKWDSAEDYAKNLAKETGVLKSEQEWPANCIDWTKAANELSKDGDVYFLPTGDGDVFVFDTNY